jgi:uncharacterized membrane protein YqaE (UPF0057 family)
MLGICSFILPCVAVAVKEGELTAHFWINILLMLCFHVPAVVHALWVVFFRDK